ncbi:MAG: YybS family protein [Candidatus Atribacteria bacterium]|nr:YybS family protein [Candidatus Atribacteria bacterium]
MRKLRPTVEGAFLAALTVILYLSSIYIPVLGFVLSFVCPLPVLFLVIRWDLRTGLLASGVATLIVLAFSGLLQALVCFVGFSLIGLGMGYLIKKERSSFEVISLGSVVSVLSKLALIGIALLLTGKNPITENLRVMEETFQKTAQMLGGMGDGNFQKILNLLTIALPAILILASLFDTVLNFFLGKWVGKRIGIVFPVFPPFGSWRFPVSVFWMFVLSWAFVLLGGTSILGTIGLNLQMVTQTLFLVQGVSVAYFFLGKYVKSKPGVIVILLFVVFQPLFSSIISWIGVIDTWFDFRKLNVR